MKSLLNKTDPDRSFDPLTGDGLTVTVTGKVPSDYYEVIGSGRKEREEIIVHPDLLQRSELVRRQNIRLIEPNNGYVAACTIAVQDTKVGGPTDIWLGPDGFTRLGKAEGDVPFDLEIDTPLLATGITDSEAQTQGETFETLEDDGSQTDMMVFAYHGGDMEAFTYEQGQTMKDRIVSNGKSASFYGTRSYTTGSDPVNAFNKWHITSVDMYLPSFPGLNSVKDRGFTYGLSFHGFTDTDRIAIGGRASSAFKSNIQTVLDNTTGPEVTVDIVSSGSYIAGNAPRNALNRLSATDNTIQIEQSYDVRSTYATQIAQDLADHYINNVLP